MAEELADGNADGATVRDGRPAPFDPDRPWRLHPQVAREIARAHGGEIELIGPSTASQIADTASALEAAVTMLRVYCSWPGASPMMNLRCSVLK